MASESLTLVVNPGSASRKYALFCAGWQWANILFEFVDGKVVGKIEHAGQQQSKIYDDTDLSNVSNYVLPLLRECSVINSDDTISVIGIRLVAPSNRFMQDELVTDEIEKLLQNLQLVAPLHVTTVLSEIKQLKTTFPRVPIVAVSDSAFHATKYPWAWDYGIDTELSDRLSIKRFGYHGISVGSVVRSLDENNMLPQKAIICHLGSGSSITAVVDGKSVDTTMGYSPLEGLVMASRSGSMDISAALAIKRDLKMSDDEIEQYLNKQSGLLGVSGRSNDIRQLISYEESGDQRASLALKLFVYHIQLAIGQMAASMNGVDCLVFTATVGERSQIIRHRILENLGYLGFYCDSGINVQTFEPQTVTNISAESSKPIIVISTNEAIEIARRAEQYLIGR